MTKAAITPGTHPQSHSKNTIKTEPHPLSNTAKGGHKIDNKTLIKHQPITIKYNQRLS